MNQLNHLQDIVDRQLGGLHATGKMLGEIKLKAAAPQKSRTLLRPVLASCTAALLLISFLAWAPQGIAPGAPTASPSVLDSQPAGDVEVTEAPQESEAPAPADLSSGDVSIGKAADLPPFQSLFVPAQGSTFPMVWVNNEAYRML